MITYEKAKELKDAGFPQNPNNIQTDMGGGAGLVWHPTLEELIEACEGEFEKLLKCDDLVGGWEAISIYEGRFEKGSTPAEAVANLWLELNKK